MSLQYPAWKAKVAVTILNVRIGPGTGYSLLSECPHLKMGDVVEVIGDYGLWYQIKIQGKQIGYVFAIYLDRI